MKKGIQKIQRIKTYLIQLLRIYENRENPVFTSKTSVFFIHYIISIF